MQNLYYHRSAIITAFNHHINNTEQSTTDKHYDSYYNVNTVFRLHQLHNVRRSRLLIQMSHVACVVCVSVCMCESVLCKNG